LVLLKTGRRLIPAGPGEANRLSAGAPGAAEMAVKTVTQAGTERPDRTKSVLRFGSRVKAHPIPMTPAQ